METRQYEIAVVGCGVVGAAIARQLSQYQLSVCILEKENDVAVQYPEEVGKIRAVAQRYREDLGDDFTGTKGKNCRSKGFVKDFTFRTFKDEDYPYMIALYD